jgi:hypothetical protein
VSLGVKGGTHARRGIRSGSKLIESRDIAQTPLESSGDSIQAVAVAPSVAGSTDRCLGSAYVVASVRSGDWRTRSTPLSAQTRTARDDFLRQATPSEAGVPYADPLATRLGLPGTAHPERR